MNKTKHKKQKILICNSCKIEYIESIDIKTNCYECNVNICEKCSDLYDENCLDCYEKIQQENEENQKIMWKDFFNSVF